MDAPLSLRDRKKEATRREILAVANRHFHQKGFHATTIDEIAEEVGISRRTFFRYFSDKEALVFPNRTERLERFLAFLSTADPAENPFLTLRRATHLFAKEYVGNRAQIVAQQRLIETSTELLAREREIDRDWEAAIAQAFRRWTGNSNGNAELRARVLAGAAIGVIRATMRHWFETEGGADLAQLGEEALDCLERGFSGSGHLDPH